MKIEYIHHFDIDRETLLALWRDPAVGKRISEGLPNLRSRELVEEVDDERTTRRKFRMTASAQIPEQARKLIQPHMLQWVEETEYDKATHVYHFTNTSLFFKDVFECTGTVAFVDDHAGGCRRELKGVVKVRVPLFGKLAESIIVKHLKENWEKEVALLQAAVAEHKAAGARKGRRGGGPAAAG